MKGTNIYYIAGTRQPNQSCELFYGWQNGVLYHRGKPITASTQPIYPGCEVSCFPPKAGSGIGLLWKGQPITAQSTPVYDGWGWADYWGCTEWQYWHQQLVKSHGRNEANARFKAAWDKQSGFANPYNWCKYNHQWINYFMSQGLDLRSVISAIIVPISTGAADVAQGAGDVASNVSSGIVNTSTIVKYALPVAAIGLVGFLGYQYYKSKK
jgi:hypothetical protein